MESVWKAVTEWIAFWAVCIWTAWTFGYGVFGFLQAALAIALPIIFWRKRQSQDIWEERAVKWPLLVLGGTFVFSTVFLAPFLRTQGESQQRETAQTALSNQLAKPNPIPLDVTVRSENQDKELRDQMPALTNTLNQLAEANRALLKESEMLKDLIRSIDPTNQPLATISASVRMKIKGAFNMEKYSERVQRLKATPGGLPFPQLEMGERGWRTNANVRKNLQLFCESMEIPRTAEESTIFLLFSSGRGPILDLFGNLTVGMLADLQDVSISTWAGILNPDTEILGGRVDMTINSSIKRHYPIIPQKQQGRVVWYQRSDITNGIPVFVYP